MRTRSLAARIGLGMATCALLVTGCSGATDDEQERESQGRPGTRAALTASVIQQRVDEGTRRIGIQVTNTGSEPFTVDSVQLIWSGTQTRPPTPKDTAFAPGQVIDLQTTYGNPRCGTPASSDAALVRVRLADGVTLDLDLEAGGEALLQRLYDRTCSLERLELAVHVAFGTQWQVGSDHGKPALLGTLVLTRQGEDPQQRVRLTGLFGSVLLAFTPAGAERLPQDLAVGRSTLTIPVALSSSNRCDGHALGGSTQTFLLSAFVRLPGLPEQRVILVPDAATQSRALGVVDAYCR